jgi:WD40-like Beta Propeller Repeat
MSVSARIGAGFLVLAACLACVASAKASLGPIRLVSKSPFEQAGSASATALSADGRYLAFQGEIGGQSGVFREQVESGAIAAVAAGGSSEVGTPTDAVAPSISADGRYVSFTTKAPLDPVHDANAASDVYVADMASSPPSYELASALDGSAAGLSYSGGSGGSQASGRVALSADGREVVFVTTADSNLTSEPGGSAEGVPTPAGQVALRDLDTEATTLVSAERDSETGAMTERPVIGGAVILKFALPRLAGAALSADGTTVAWLGAHLPAQVPLLAGEKATIEELDTANALPYDEPLWRRVADGHAAPTRRVVGGDDPPFPGIAKKDEGLNVASGWLGVARVNGVPQLSADGRLVGLIGNPTEATNVFLVDMASGLSRRQAMHQLTREIVVNPSEPGKAINQLPFLAINGHVFDLAISPDGSHIAFASARQQFPLVPPNLVTPPPGQVGLVELYLIDGGQVLQRVTHGTGGSGEASLAPAIPNATEGGGAASPSFGAAGSLIAFSSDASNLAAGDGNEASDAFLVESSEASSATGSGELSSAPRRQRKRPWLMTMSAYSLPHGGVRLVALVPGPGALRARAFATLTAQSSSRELASGRKRARRGGTLKLDLALPPGLRRLAHRREGLYAMVHASFHRHGRKTLRADLQVRFRAHPGKGGKGRGR